MQYRTRYHVAIDVDLGQLLLVDGEGREAIYYGDAGVGVGVGVGVGGGGGDGRGSLWE